MKTSKTLYLIFISCIYFIFLSSCKKNNNSENISSKDPIPLKSIHFDFTSFEINPKKDTVVYHESGSKIFIPENAFTDKQNNLIQDTINIIYREFHNAFDIYLAGINNTILHNNVKKSLETVGLAEIYASCKGKQVFIHPEKKLRINLTSFDDAKKLNIYYSDTINNKWIKKGNDSLLILNFEEELLNLTEIPPEPVIAGPYAFSLGDSIEGFPEFDIYENIMFEPIIKKKCGFTGTKTSVEYLEDGIYRIKFTFERFGIKNEQSCDCYLAFKKGRDHERALKVYQKKYSKQIQDQEINKLHIENQKKTYQNLRQKYNGLGLLILFHSTETNTLSKDNRFSRLLLIDSLGVYNVGNPVPYPSDVRLRADFNDTEGNNIPLTHIALVERGTNTVFRYSDSVSFNINKRNILWGITNSEKPAYFKEGQFDRIRNNEGDYIFSMKIFKKGNPSYTEICTTLF